MRNFHELANHYRDIPLEEVVYFLGGNRDQTDLQKWRLGDKSIWLGKDQDSQRFYDHQSGQGGGGAIDLVMYVEGCDFKVAIERLSLISGNHSSVKSVTAIPAHRTTEESVPLLFISPRSDARHLRKAIDYLTVIRGIPHAVVQHAVDSGQIYTDSRRNVIFLCNDETGLKTGAEIRGTGKVAYKGMTIGSQRGIGFFTLDHPNPSSLVIVESAIDALSYRALYPTDPSVIISTAGVLPQCPPLAKLAKDLGVAEIVVAYDNDHAGDEGALKLMNSIEGSGVSCRRSSPDAKDWNNYLTYCLDIDYLVGVANG